MDTPTYSKDNGVLMLSGRRLWTEGVNNLYNKCSREGLLKKGMFRDRFSDKRLFEVDTVNFSPH